jgi:hypothetical protein
MKDTKFERKMRLHRALEALGFENHEIAALRRIEMTLHRWHELECGTDAGSIQRDETTGKPFSHRSGFMGYGGKWIEPKPYAIPDREKGAEKRLAAIVKARNERQTTLDDSHPCKVFAYVQGDPRGCALYLITRAQLGDNDIGSVYNRGVAICE